MGRFVAHSLYLFCSFSFSELRFVLNNFIADSDTCNQPDNIDEGIILSFRAHQGAEWIPLAFYGVVYTKSNGLPRRSGKVQITSAVVSTTDKVINIIGYNVPLNQNVLSNSEHVVKLCDETLVRNGVQFRWLQTAAHLGDSSRTLDGWYLDNITIVGRNGQGSSCFLSENFENGKE